MASPLTIPAQLAERVVAWEGESGRRWLAELPGIVATISERWDLDVAEPYQPGGSISWVAPVRRRADGLDAVLKIQHPHPESEPEAAGLAAWRGRGAVHLLAHEPSRCALLVERCEPGAALGAGGGTAAAVAAGAAVGACLHEAAVPANLPTLASVLARWADELEPRLDAHPLTDPAFAALALETMRTRPQSCPDQVLLHGDLNPDQRPLRAP